MKKVIYIIFIQLLYCTSILNAQTIRYVKSTASGIGDGSSWTNASSNLQAMINESAAGDEVWVAAGTYLPTLDPFANATPADARDKTFFIKDGVKIYGGFSASTPETTLTARNITDNATILSGDIGVTNTITDNVYHVVLAVAPAGGLGVTIDGFSITGSYGNFLSSVTINTFTIRRGFGGAIYLYGGINTVANNLMYNNTNDSGTGIYANTGNHTISNNKIFNNTASTSSGGIYTNLSTIALNNNTIHNNTSVKYAGIYSTQGTNTLTGNIIYNNVATGAGGTDAGGGVSLIGGTSQMTNNVIYYNSSGNYGGGIFVNTGSHTFTNNIIYNNTAFRGGGIYKLNGTISVINNTIYNNTATNSGGGVQTYNDSNLLKNNIFWGNKKIDSSIVPGSDYMGTSTNTLENNLLQLDSINYTILNGNRLGTNSGNIFALNPLFVDAADPDGLDNILGTSDDGFALQATSLVINKGNNIGVPETDFVGVNRMIGGIADLGAYESLTFFPVELMNFNGKNLSDYNLLEWHTASENNNQGFEIEKSSDGLKFEKIGFEEGAGTSTQIQNYTFKDLLPNQNVSYYRLKQIDYDGGFKYSNIVSILQSSKKVVNVFPNPSRDIFTIKELKSFENELFTISNSNGQILPVTIQNNGKFDLTNYPSGIYYLHATKIGSVTTLIKD